MWSFEIALFYIPRSHSGSGWGRITEDFATKDIAAYLSFRRFLETFGIPVSDVYTRKWEFTDRPKRKWRLDSSVLGCGLLLLNEGPKALNAVTKTARDKDEFVMLAQLGLKRQGL